MSKLFSTVTLKNGSQLKNPIVKAAMEEGMSAPGQVPGDALFNLYQKWSQGGLGALITGNVMIDHRAMTGPGGVVLEKQTNIEPFVTWAQAAKSGGSQVWMQINHPGRQIPKELSATSWAPSEVPLDLGKFSDRFTKPVSMSEAQIEEVIQRFTDTALKAQEAGFDGVQIHAAHGYLLSQFLSPLSNVRKDQWGGSLENRAKLLLKVVESVSSATNPSFVISVKLNSADFQKGGFDTKEAQQVVSWLAKQNVEFVELSGGSYEAPAMQRVTKDGSTLAREAYFLEFAQQIAQTSDVTIMTTGGIFRKQTAQNVLDQNVGLIGIAKALTVNPNLVNDWKNGVNETVHIPAPTSKNKVLASIMEMSMAQRQLQRLGKNKKPKTSMNAWFTFIKDQVGSKKITKRYLDWKLQQSN